MQDDIQRTAMLPGQTSSSLDVSQHRCGHPMRQTQTSESSTQSHAQCPKLVCRIHSSRLLLYKDSCTCRVTHYSPALIPQQRRRCRRWRRRCPSALQPCPACWGPRNPNPRRRRRLCRPRRPHRPRCRCRRCRRCRCRGLQPCAVAVGGGEPLPVAQQVLVIRLHLAPEAAAEHVVCVCSILPNTMQLGGARPLQRRGDPLVRAQGMGVSSAQGLRLPSTGCV
jgi:hypothetical protein